MDTNQIVTTAITAAYLKYKNVKVNDPDVALITVVSLQLDKYLYENSNSCFNNRNRR